VKSETLRWIVATTITTAIAAARLYLTWRANKLPVLRFGPAAFDPDLNRPIKWWYVPVTASKTRFWQADIAKECTVQVTIYGEDGKCKSVKPMLWRTSKGPKPKFNLSMSGPHGIIPVAVRHTVGEDWPIHPDVVGAPPINLKTNTAIITDEDAMNQRILEILDENKAVPVEFKVYCEGRLIGVSPVYFLYVPEARYDNEAFKLLDWTTL
jgi:hypothetical protein